MKNYQCILFDADETLFEFNAFKGLQRMFLNYGVAFNELDYDAYQTLNKSLWVEYQNGTISVQALKEQRFTSWAEKLAVSPQTLNSAFLTAMTDICEPLAGAVSLLNVLKGKVKLGIITNGFTEMQQARLERTGFKEHFHAVVVSEEVGVAKPHPDIFEHALIQLGNPAREQVLMVGDTLESDILGGINAGLDTCWLNTSNKSLSIDIKPHYQVTSLAQLEQLLFNNI